MKPYLFICHNHLKKGRYMRSFLYARDMRFIRSEE